MTRVYISGTWVAILGVGSNESMTLWSSKPPIYARLVTDGPSHRRACLTGYTDSEKATGPLKGLSSLFGLSSRALRFGRLSLR